jgi:acylphosphatase
VSTIRRRVVVHGRVQGVFFRETTRLEAEAHGVAGWVQNLPDGTVEAVFEGPEPAVAALLRFAAQGPPDAQVDHVTAAEEPPQGLQGFEVRQRRSSTSRLRRCVRTLRFTR